MWHGQAMCFLRLRLYALPWSLCDWGLAVLMTGGTHLCKLSVSYNGLLGFNRKPFRYVFASESRACLPLLRRSSTTDWATFQVFIDFEFWDWVSLSSPAWLRTHAIVQTGLTFWSSFLSPQVLGSQSHHFAEVRLFASTSSVMAAPCPNPSAGGHHFVNL